MTTVLWIAVGFVLLLIIFMMVVTFKIKDMTHGQYNIVRFLSALCAGFAGGLITGQALFSMAGKLANGLTISVSGTAGFAIFFAVWYGYKLYQEPPPPDGVKISILDKWTFKAALEVLASMDAAVIEYSGFTSEQLATPLRTAELQDKTVAGLMGKIGSLARAFPMYTVAEENKKYLITCKA